MTNVNPDTGEIPEGAELSESRLVGLLATLLGLRHQRDDSDRRYKALSGPVRDYLDKHPDEQLRDGEHGIVARLQQRQGGPDLDTMSLAEADPDLALWAMKHGLMKLDGAAWKALAEKGAEAAKLRGWISKLSGTTALIIEREER